MKKKILIIVLFIGLALSLGIAIFLSFIYKNNKQTNNPTPSEEQRKNVVLIDEETQEEYYLLADFENYYECTQVKYGASFGKATEVNKAKNPDMVTNGEQSIKLEILGTEETWNKGKPYMHISTSNGFFNLTSDFSNMDRITFDIYNSQDYEASVRFCVNPNVSSHTTAMATELLNLNYAFNVVNVIKLKANSWNHIEIPAEDIRVRKADASGNYYFVYGAEALRAVRGFQLVFDRGELHEKQEVFYLDNVRAYTKGKLVEEQAKQYKISDITGADNVKLPNGNYYLGELDSRSVSIKMRVDLTKSGDETGQFLLSIGSTDKESAGPADGSGYQFWFQPKNGKIVIQHGEPNPGEKQGIIKQVAWANAEIKENFELEIGTRVSKFENGDEYATELYVIIDGQEIASWIDVSSKDRVMGNYLVSYLSGKLPITLSDVSVE